MKPKQETIEKYLKWLNAIYTEKTFKALRMRVIYGIDAPFISRAKKAGKVKNMGDGTWISTMDYSPTEQDVRDVMKVQREQNKNRVNKNKRKNYMKAYHQKKKSNGLTEDACIKFLKEKGCYRIIKIQEVEL